jgi:AAA domain
MTFPFPADADRLLATLRDGAWLDAQVFPPLSYAVPGLIPEGSVLLVGAPKIGKSWLVLAVGLAASDGGGWRPPAAGPLPTTAGR